MRTTLVLGASEDIARYSNKAVKRLRKAGKEVVAIGRRDGWIDDVPIVSQWPESPQGIHTVTLYINPSVQVNFYDKLMALQPQRIIFNPGSENAVLEKLAKAYGIETLNACTLVMLSVGNY